MAVVPSHSSWPRTYTRHAVVVMAWRVRQALLRPRLRSMSSQHSSSTTTPRRRLWRCTSTPWSSRTLTSASSRPPTTSSARSPATSISRRQRLSPVRLRPPAPTPPFAVASLTRRPARGATSCSHALPRQALSATRLPTRSSNSPSTLRAIAVLPTRTTRARQPTSARWCAVR